MCKSNIGNISIYKANTSDVSTFCALFFLGYIGQYVLCVLTICKKIKSSNQRNTRRTLFNTNHRFPRPLFYGRDRSSTLNFKHSAISFSSETSESFEFRKMYPIGTRPFFPVCAHRPSSRSITRAACPMVIRTSSDLPRAKVDRSPATITALTAGSLGNRKRVFRIGFTTKTDLPLSRRTFRRFARFFFRFFAEILSNGIAKLTGNGEVTSI